jgi:hypothetical protein
MGGIEAPQSLDGQTGFDLWNSLESIGNSATEWGSEFAESVGRMFSVQCEAPRANGTQYHDVGDVRTERVATQIPGVLVKRINYCERADITGGWLPDFFPGVHGEWIAEEYTVSALPHDLSVTEDGVNHDVYPTVTQDHQVSVEIPLADMRALTPLPESVNKRSFVSIKEHLDDKVSTALTIESDGQVYHQVFTPVTTLGGNTGLQFTEVYSIANMFRRQPVE